MKLYMYYVFCLRSQSPMLLLDHVLVLPLDSHVMSTLVSPVDSAKPCRHWMVMLEPTSVE